MGKGEESPLRCLYLPAVTTVYNLVYCSFYFANCSGTIRLD